MMSCFSWRFIFLQCFWNVTIQLILSISRHFPNIWKVNLPWQRWCPGLWPGVSLWCSPCISYFTSECWKPQTQKQIRLQNYHSGEYYSSIRKYTFNFFKAMVGRKIHMCIKAQSMLQCNGYIWKRKPLSWRAFKK